MKNTLYNTALALCSLVFMLACSEDEYTGDSTMKVVSPSLNVQLDFTNNQSLIEEEVEYGFTVSISEPQIVNVIVYLNQISGTATNGEDFTIPESVTIPIGSTSTYGVIKIHGDDLAEETETAVIQIATGNESNVSPITGSTVSFSIMNYTEGDIVIDMSWTSPRDYTDVLGNPVSDEAIVDLILTVNDVNIPTTINHTFTNSATGFETFVFQETFPDGAFYLTASFFDVEDYTLEEFDGYYTDLDVSLTFNQPGKINDLVVTIPAALNTAFADCQSTIIAKITKSGSNFSIEPVGLGNSLGPADSGTYLGDYLIEETTPLVSGYTLQSGDVITLYETTIPNQRGFMTANFVSFCSTPNEFLFELNPFCGKIIIPGVGNQSNCSCDSNLFFSTATSPTTFDPSDDSVFEVTFTNDPFQDCSQPVQTTYRFTKQ